MNNKIIETKDLIFRKARQENANERIERTIKFQQKHLVTFLVYDKNIKQAIGLAGFFEKEKGIYEDCGIGIGPSLLEKGMVSKY